MLHPGRGPQDVELAAGLRAVIDVSRSELLPRCPQFMHQQADACRLVHRAVVDGVAASVGQQLGHHALVHVGVLAQVDGGKVEAKDVDGAAQLTQAATGEQSRGVDFQ